MATVVRPLNYTMDTEMELKDAGLVASSAAAQVDSSAQVIDLGASLPSDATPPLFHGDVVIDVSAIEVASNDELYTILIEGCDESAFSSGVEELAAIRLGANEVLTGGSDVDSDTGRYVISFTNQRNTRRYRYIRAYTVVSGTIATGINYTAFVAPKNR